MGSLYVTVRSGVSQSSCLIKRWLSSGPSTALSRRDSAAPLPSPSHQPVKATRVTTGRSATVQGCPCSSAAATKPPRSCVSIALWCLLRSLWLLQTPPNVQSWALGFFFLGIWFGMFCSRGLERSSAQLPVANVKEVCWVQQLAPPSANILLYL